MDLSLENFKNLTNSLIPIYFISYIFRNESAFFERFIPITDSILPWVRLVEVLSFLALLILLFSIFVFEIIIVRLKSAVKKNWFMFFFASLAFVPLVFSILFCQQIKVFNSIYDSEMMEKARLAHKVNMEDLSRSIEKRSESTIGVARTIYWENQELWAVINEDGSEGVFVPSDEDIKIVQRKQDTLQQMKNTQEMLFGSFILNQFAIAVGIIIGFFVGRNRKKALQ